MVDLYLNVFKIEVVKVIFYSERIIIDDFFCIQKP